MEMGAGGKPGIARPGHDLSLLDQIIHADLKSRKMHIDRIEPG